MRKLFAAFVLVMLSSSCFAATIKFFTDYPNTVPVGSDFFVFQRNQSYINSTVSQVKGDWFNNPSFTGNGSISGAFGVGGLLSVNGIYYGNGAGLTNVPVSSTNVNLTFITNNILYSTNIFATTNFIDYSFTTNLFVTTEYVTNLYVTTNFVDNSITTNLFVTQEYVTNIVAGTITNNTFFTTNVFVDNSVTINSNLTVQTITNNTFYSTNTTIENITNVNLYSTNITVQNITNNTFITTNVVINQTGGLTNFNAVPSTLAYWDVNDALSSLPNATGVLTNNGSGGVGFSTSLSLSEIDAQNFYPTNMFTGITNSVLGTDGDGKLIATNTSSITVSGTNVNWTPILWVGPTNLIVANNGYQQYATATPTSITNLTTTSQWATLIISNSLANSITQFCTVPNIRFIGANSTNALTVGAGKVGVWSFLTFAGQLTNCVNLSQQ